MARLAERGEKISGLKRLVLWIQQALRKWKWKWAHDLANRIEATTDAEALEMLAKARLFVRTGGTIRGSNKSPSFSRNRNIVAKLTESEIVPKEGQSWADVAHDYYRENVQVGDEIIPARVTIEEDTNGKLSAVA